MTSTSSHSQAAPGPLDQWIPWLDKAAAIYVAVNVKARCRITRFNLTPTQARQLHEGTGQQALMLGYPVHVRTP